MARAPGGRAGGPTVASVPREPVPSRPTSRPRGRRRERLAVAPRLSGDDRGGRVVGAYGATIVVVDACDRSIDSDDDVGPEPEVGTGGMVDLTPDTTVVAAPTRRRSPTRSTSAGRPARRPPRFARSARVSWRRWGRRATRIEQRRNRRARSGARPITTSSSSGMQRPSGRTRDTVSDAGSITSTRTRQVSPTATPTSQRTNSVAKRDMPTIPTTNAALAVPARGRVALTSVDGLHLGPAHDRSGDGQQDPAATTQHQAGDRQTERPAGNGAPRIHGPGSTVRLITRRRAVGGDAVGRWHRAGQGIPGRDPCCGYPDGWAPNPGGVSPNPGGVSPNADGVSPPRRCSVQAEPSQYRSPPGRSTSGYHPGGVTAAPMCVRLLRRRCSRAPRRTRCRRGSAPR